MVNVDAKLAGGYIHSRVVIELAGKPKEHIEKTMEVIVGKIKENKNIEIVSKDIAEAKEIEEQKGFFSMFAELELLLNSLPVLIGFCFDYMPSSVEIIAPEEMKMNARELSGFLNDLQAKLHRTDMSIKQLSMENQFLKNNVNKLLKNMVTILLLKKERKCEELAQVIGFKAEDLQKFLDHMVEENKLRKEGDTYFLVKNEREK
ncbi:hypothetical protein KY331_06160 [Candidatus Woesearchaeota archaeon]|nr:hypothetical protein [Candidatus Woesearchaeota archaeon]